MYCGNNFYDLLKSGELGTPYGCMKKGIGVGLNSDISNLNPKYKKIIDKNIYCGNEKKKNKGDPLSCLRKGIGVGKFLKYKNTIEKYENNNDYSTKSLKYWLILILFITIIILIGFIIYYKLYNYIYLVVILLIIIFFIYLK